MKNHPISKDYKCETNSKDTMPGSVKDLTQKMIALKKKFSFSRKEIQQQLKYQKENKKPVPPIKL